MNGGILSYLKSVLLRKEGEKMSREWRVEERKEQRVVYKRLRCLGSTEALPKRYSPAFVRHYIQR
jgi:hypothetical protein